MYDDGASVSGGGTALLSGLISGGGDGLGGS